MCSLNPLVGGFEQRSGDGGTPGTRDPPGLNPEDQKRELPPQRCKEASQSTFLSEASGNLKLGEMDHGTERGYWYRWCLAYNPPPCAFCQPTLTTHRTNGENTNLDAVVPSRSDPRDQFHHLSPIWPTPIEHAHGSSKISRTAFEGVSIVQNLCSETTNYGASDELTALRPASHPLEGSIRPRSLLWNLPVIRYSPPRAHWMIEETDYV